MRDEFKPAIDALRADLADLEHRIAETKTMINRLCELSGAPPMYPDVSVQSSKLVTGLRSDQFYGKVLTTAAREYLEIRKASNLGPASPREIYESLVAGGFKFDTKIETNAITGLRQVLRKNSSIFHRLPHGQYGLLAWYPNAKAFKADDEEGEGEGPTMPRRRAARRAARRARRSKKLHSGTGESVKRLPKGSVTPFVLEAMQDGKEWTTDRLRQEAIGRGVVGVDEMVSKKVFQGAILSLQRSGKIMPVQKGVWRISEPGQDTRRGIVDDPSGSKTLASVARRDA